MLPPIRKTHLLPVTDEIEEQHEDVFDDCEQDEEEIALQVMPTYLQASPDFGQTSTSNIWWQKSIRQSKRS